MPGFERKVVPLLRSARFFWDIRPDLVTKKDLIAGVSELLDDKNMADLAIEDLRKWAAWDVCDRVLDLFEKESHNIPIVRRSILRYALSCPKEKAVTFVAERRKADPQTVADVEELLKLDATPAVSTPATSSAESKVNKPPLSK